MTTITYKGFRYTLPTRYLISVGNYREALVNAAIDGVKIIKEKI